MPLAGSSARHQGCSVSQSRVGGVSIDVGFQARNLETSLNEPDWSAIDALSCAVSATEPEQGRIVSVPGWNDRPQVVAERILRDRNPRETCAVIGCGAFPNL